MKQTLAVFAVLFLLVATVGCSAPLTKREKGFVGFWLSLPYLRRNPGCPKVSENSDVPTNKDRFPPALGHLTLTFSARGTRDVQRPTFGVREIAYSL